MKKTAKHAKRQVVKRTSRRPAAKRKLNQKKKQAKIPVNIPLKKKQQTPARNQRKPAPAKRPVDKESVEKLLKKEESLETSQKSLITRLEKDARAIKAEEERIAKEETLLQKTEADLAKKAQDVKSGEVEIKSLQEKNLKEESHIKSLEQKEVSLSEQEIQKLQELERLEQQIRKDVAPHPLAKVTYRDVVKGLIGAFVALVLNFAFIEGMHISEGLSVWRATLLLIISFIIVLLFVYYAGFRRVQQTIFLKVFPSRVFVIFFTAIIAIYVLLLVYGFIGVSTGFLTVYKQMASISILAVIGAGTADLIGKD